MKTELKSSVNSTYTTKAELDEHGLGKGVREDGVVVFFDSSGQSHEHLKPAELMVSAFAACILKNVERFSKNPLLEFNYEGASILVHAKQEEDRITEIVYELKVETDENERRVNLLHKNIKIYGTIFNTISNACDEVTGEICPLEPDSEDELEEHKYCSNYDYSMFAKRVRPGISESRRSDEVKIEFDTADEKTPGYLGPADLLVNAFAADVLSSLPENKDASVSVIATREENPPRITKIEYEVKVGTTDEESDQLKNKINKGVVFKTLSKACEITGKITSAHSDA